MSAGPPEPPEEPGPPAPSGPAGQPATPAPAAPPASAPAHHGPVGARPANPEDELQRWARLQVRAGLDDPAALLVEVVSAIEAELPGIEAGILARAWIGGAQADLRRAASGWPTPSDHDRLTAAYAECREHGVAVAEGVADERSAGPVGARGLVWFDREAVWRAIETGVLDTHLRGPEGRAAEEGDWLTAAVLGCLDRHGLRARWFDEHVQVATRWQRRP